MGVETESETQKDPLDLYQRPMISPLSVCPRPCGQNMLFLFLLEVQTVQ